MIKLPLFLKELIEKIEKTATEDSVAMLFQYLLNSNENLKEITPVLFKYQNFIIQIFHKLYGEPYLKKLRMLDKNDVNIAPKLINFVYKENSIYLISHISGSKTGDLIPIENGYQMLSQTRKERAFKDLKKLINLGYFNQKALGKSEWYITPDNKALVIPDWTELKAIRKDEEEKTLKNLQSILFS